MMIKTIFTIVLITMISVVMAQDVVRDKEIDKSKVSSTPDKAITSIQVVKLDAELVPVKRENNNGTKPPVAGVIPKIADKPVTKKQTKTTNK